MSSLYETFDNESRSCTKNHVRDIALVLLILILILLLLVMMMVMMMRSVVVRNENEIENENGNTYSKYYYSNYFEYYFK